MIIVVTNRNLVQGATGSNLFGEGTNAKGPDEIRLATANYDPSDKRWQLTLVPETSLAQGTAPSQLVFSEVMAGIRAGKYKQQWVFYIHGFNQSFQQSLEASWRIAQLYGVDVILFSWPSNPGGVVLDEYKRARQAAKASANALDRTLEKLGKYLKSRPLAEIQRCPISLNLLVHSLGNYLVENFVRDPIFAWETRIFDNLIFHQADVDNRLHKYWIDRLDYSRRIYVTINEEDLILKASDMINPARLGNTLQGLNGRRPIYMDFTRGQNIGGAHDLFMGIPGNEIVTQFFREVLRGNRGETVDGFTFDSRINAFRL
ncbi:MAG TPA: alpha/beta hydrolase [Trichocoleus sp.]